MRGDRWIGVNYTDPEKAKVVQTELTALKMERVPVEQLSKPVVRGVEDLLA
jgi:hypothetical protein